MQAMELRCLLLSQWDKLWVPHLIHQASQMTIGKSEISMVAKVQVCWDFECFGIICLLLFGLLYFLFYFYFSFFPSFFAYFISSEIVQCSVMLKKPKKLICCLSNKTTYINHRYRAIWSQQRIYRCIVMNLLCQLKLTTFVGISWWIHHASIIQLNSIQ